MAKEIFKTSDTILAATLLTLGFSPIKFEKSNEHIVISFSLSNSLKEKIDAYWSRKIEIEPISFHLNFKRLRSIIDDEMNDES